MEMTPSSQVARPQISGRKAPEAVGSATAEANNINILVNY
jgi:hypothetical protein